MSISQDFDGNKADGSVMLYQVTVTDNDQENTTKYLKVVKSANDLITYETDDAKEVFKCTTLSRNFSGSFSVANDSETWTITLDNQTDFTSMSMLREMTPEAWGGSASVSYPGASILASGTTKYFTSNIVTVENTVTTRFFKVVKGDSTSSDSGALNIYEADSLAGAISADAPSVRLSGTWMYNQEGHTEQWTVSFMNGEYYLMTDFNEVGTVLEVSDLPTGSGLPTGAESYCKVTLLRSNGTLEAAYLKVHKESNGLSVFKADTLDSFDTNPDINFQAESVITGMESPYSESWYLAIRPSDFNFGTQYSRFITVSPLCTNVTAAKVWSGQKGANFVDVAVDTLVQFELTRNGAHEKTIYVKKTADNGQKKLQVSFDKNVSFSDSLVFEGKTLNVLLVPANNAGTTYAPERWVITLTGYDNHEANGSLAEFKVLEKDISSTQHWKPMGTSMVTTFAGEEQTGNASIAYTLVLRPVVGEEIDLLRITKTITGDSGINCVSVEGLDCQLDTASGQRYTCATVTEALCGEKHEDAVNGKMVFNDSSDIKLSDIISRNDGVTVTFRTGEDNGCASVTIKLTSSGKLSYEFNGLPADVYMVDPNTELSTINVASYSVRTEKRNN